MIFMFLLLTCLSLGDLQSNLLDFSCPYHWLIPKLSLCKSLGMFKHMKNCINFIFLKKSLSETPDLWVYSCWCKDFPSPSCLSLALNPWFVELLFLTFLVYLFIWWSLPPRAFFQKWYMGDKMSRGRSGFILY